jgi:ferrochelatase
MRVGVVLLNMGGVSSLEEVPVFLSNMFNDKNIIGVKSNILRAFIAKMIVLARANKAKANYKIIGGKSPLLDLSDKLIELLNSNSEVYFTKAMRYTPPFAKEAIKELKSHNIEDVILFPLYPQYSTTTTKSSVEDFILGMYAQNYTPKNIRVINRFYDNPKFIDIICDELESIVHNHNNYELIFSAHSLPQKIIDKGDSYQQEVKNQIELIKVELKKRDIEFNSISLAYQSKLGPIKWLEPALDTKLKEYKNKKIVIYPISFIIDNAETVLELDIEYRELSLKHGIDEYIVAKCPNYSDSFVDFIKDLI